VTHDCSPTCLSGKPKVEDIDEGEDEAPAQPELKIDDPVNDDNEVPDVEEEIIDDGIDLSDELACISGVRPKSYIRDGEEREEKSMTSSAVYKIKRTWDHYYW
jgi:DNA ligase 1